MISKHKSPFFSRYSYFYHFPIQCDKLNKLTESILGKHNFTSFSKRNSDTINNVCEIYEAHWKETRGLVLFYVAANRFLHGMVRTITGTLLHTLKENPDNSNIEDIIKSNKRENAAESAPAKGLFLYKVQY